MKHAAVLCTIFAVGLAGCGSSSAHACVTAPQPFPSNRLLTSGTELTVPVGAIVYVVLVEPAAYSGPGFPWLTPASSDPSVLAPVRLCKRTGASSLPLTVTVEFPRFCRHLSACVCKLRKDGLHAEVSSGVPPASVDRGALA